MVRIHLIIFFLFSFIYSFGQIQCDQVLFTGKVEDTLNFQSFYNLMIVNRTKGSGVFGQPNGHFSVYVSDNDSISISVKGYPIVGVRVHADENCQFVFNAQIIKKAIELQEFVIQPLKTLAQIREERESLALRETRTVRGAEMLQSPITALYQAFSRSAKNDKWIAQQVYKDDQRRIVKELLHLYVAYDIINLTEDEFEDFIDFLNINDEFIKTAKELELVTFVQDKFEHFRQMNNLTFAENNNWKINFKEHREESIKELLRIYDEHQIIQLPEFEFDRFIIFSNLDDLYLLNAREPELVEYMNEKYNKFVTFYKLENHYLQKKITLTIQDNYIWKAELACKNNLKSAVNELFKMYRFYNIIELSADEMERFTTFANLSETFLRKSTENELIIFVLEKQNKYINFYKLK